MSDFGSSSYGSSTDETSGVVTFTLFELPPGETVTISVAGARTTTAERMTTYTLDVSGEEFAINTVTSSPTNMGVFAPVVVPASGRITITAKPKSGGYSFLTAVKITFEP